ncbi:MAG: hypothetical protein HOI43_13170 [Gammaproteobacteria bacterium]|jgi:ectoine hydroxylase-related dioxygenase (phytanoyl-CoA dioxygenase family)|nr:hypothetical protein [Gammaproteobacteria bacterium]
MANYFLVKNQEGDLLRANANKPEFTSNLDDNCIWSYQDNVLSCAGNGFKLSYQPGEEIQHQSTSLCASSTQLPSEHLAELHRDGVTILDNLLNADAITRIKTQVAQRRALNHTDESPFDGFFWMQGGLHWCLDLVRAVSNPVALSVMQEFMQTDQIHFSHPPVITTLKPAKELLGTFPDDGWHADYPYHPGVFPDEHWPDEPPLGVQFNICIDPFEKENGGTQYLPGSHHRRHWPPAEFNQGGTRMGKGLHTDVKQFEAPAGSAILYDSRTWHRRCDEANVSGKDRIAILNAVTPSWVLPMSDKEAASDSYQTSEIFNQISMRERQDIDRLFCQVTSATPAGTPILGQRIPREKR